MKLILALALASFSIAATAQNTIKTKYFEIDAPEGWVLMDAASSPMTEATLVNNSEESDGFDENLTLVLEDIPSPKVSLDSYSEFSEKRLEKGLADFKLLGSEKVKVDGKPAIHRTFTGSQGEMNLWFSQFIFIRKGQAHVYTFTSLGDLSEEDKKALTDLGFSLKLF